MSGTDANPSVRSSAGVTLGLRENWQQFSLLVLINAFVGGMVGLERTVVPLIGSEEFKIASTTIVVSFIVSFGIVKAVANLVSGHFADVYGTYDILGVRAEECSGIRQGRGCGLRRSRGATVTLFHGSERPRFRGP
jgi:hypothetical protein